MQRAQDLEVAALLLGRAEEERSRLEAELRGARDAAAVRAPAPALPVRARFGPRLTCHCLPPEHWHALAPELSPSLAAQNQMWRAYVSNRASPACSGYTAME